MGFNKGSFGEFNAQAAFEDEQTYRTMGDQWVKDSLYLSDSKYLGHYIAFEESVTIASNSQTYTDTNTSRAYDSDIINTDITNYIPKNIVDPKGLFGFCHNQISITGTKTKSDMTIESIASMGYHYNNLGGSGLRYISYYSLNEWHSDADNIKFYIVTTSSAIIPIHRIENKYYITWRHQYTFTNMTTVSAEYFNSIYIYLIGFFI